MYSLIHSGGNDPVRRDPRSVGRQRRARYPLSQAAGPQVITLNLSEAGGSEAQGSEGNREVTGQVPGLNLNPRLCITWESE